jgi:hypothetical protein
MPEQEVTRLAARKYNQAGAAGPRLVVVTGQHSRWYRFDEIGHQGANAILRRLSGPLAGGWLNYR